jgi:hypothetical protein
MQGLVGDRPPGKVNPKSCPNRISKLRGGSVSDPDISRFALSAMYKRYPGIDHVCRDNKCDALDSAGFEVLGIPVERHIVGATVQDCPGYPYRAAVSGSAVQ